MYESSEVHYIALKPMTFSTKVFSSKEEAAEFLAGYIVIKINAFGPSPEKPFVLGLPTGSSPEGVYKELVRAYKEGSVSFENVVTFNMDEYVGLAPSHPQSYNYYMYDKLFNHTDFQRKNIHILCGIAPDADAECARYERAIKKYGPIHLFLGGLGPTGHLAFNEAGLARDSRTRPIALAESTIEANSRFFENDRTLVPTKALTVGVSTIIDNSAEVALVVFGSSKRKIMNKLLESALGDSNLPASFLKEHSNVMLVCDQEALPESKL